MAEALLLYRQQIIVKQQESLHPCRRYESLFILDAKLLCDVAELALIVPEDLSASHRVRKHSIEQVRDLSRMDRAKLGVATGFFMKYI